MTHTPAGLNSDALEAAAKAILGDDWDWFEPEGREEMRVEARRQARAAISAYLASLPQSGTELVKSDLLDIHKRLLTDSRGHGQYYHGAQLFRWATTILDAAMAIESQSRLLAEAEFWLEGCLNHKGWWSADQHAAASDSLIRIKATLSVPPRNPEGEK